MPIVELAPVDVQAELARGGVALLDVREPEEVQAGYIPNAICIPREQLAVRAHELPSNRGAAVAVYCQSGVRSRLAAQQLIALGYEHIINMTGGYRAWQAAKLPFVTSGLTADQSTRFARHLRLSEVGVEGQKKLLAARVVLVGAGGLGSPVALYLAAAGVGCLDIIDDDIVDLTNLQRQILHGTTSVGQAKVDSASQALARITPETRVRTHQVRLNASNVHELLQGADVVVDGTDNFAARYLINDAAIARGIPVVHAAIFRFEGQATVFGPHGAPCYRCLFPEPPPADGTLSCSEAGVLGVLPGLLGVVQATETIKLILGVGTTLVGRLVLYDALAMTWRELPVARDQSCVLCGPRPESNAATE